MTDQDKLMGTRDGERVYASYRIDYATTDDIRFREIEDGPAGPEEETGGSVRTEQRFTGSAKSPLPDNPDHEVKDGYERKILVEDESTRDEVTEYLDSISVSHEVENVSPSAAEMDAIERYGAVQGVEAGEALIWNDALESAATVEDMKAVERGVHPDTGEEFRRFPDRR